MSYIPMNYQNINITYGSYQPNDTQLNAGNVDYWERVLFQRACYSIILDTQDVFDGRSKNFLFYCLFKYGYVPIWKDDRYGLVFNPAGLKGYNIYYQPTTCVVANPVFKKTKYLEVGKTCELIQLTPDYRGIWDTISYYANKLATIDPAIDVAITNSKVPFILYGRTKAARESLKKLVDRINKGLSSIFVDSRLTDNADGKSPVEMLDRPHLKETYLTDRILQDRMTLMQEFDREIGISTVPYQKKERMTEYESSSSIEESQARVTIWVECLNESFKQVNEKYGTNFSAERRSVVNGSSKSDVDRAREFSQYE